MPYPIFTSINPKIYASIMSTGDNDLKRYDTTLNASKYVPFIRVISGTGKGLIFSSNPDVPLLSETTIPIYDKKTKALIGTAKDVASVYGSKFNAGFLGYDWKLDPVYPFVTPFTGDLVLRPSPIITGLEIKEGKDQISRHATLTIKCFSLAQAEKMQEYCMEPGHSLLIEYGWNKDIALKELIPVEKRPGTPSTNDEIVITTANENLNESTLYSKRIDSEGHYDSFFGFIVGGSLSSEAENYTLTVKLRGMPGLPTFLQLHQNINPLTDEVDANGKVIGKKIIDIPVAPPYSDYELVAVNAGNMFQTMGSRRWKWMYNNLPAQRQTPEVTKIIDKIYQYNTTVGWWDLINFDRIAANSVYDFCNDNLTETLKTKVGLLKEFTVGSTKIPKERLVSENRYIRFERAIDILNANNGLVSYKIGNKQVKIRISSKAFIGAFPGIFSTKPSKLIIPGKIPDFQTYYLNPNSVDVNSILNQPFVDNTIFGAPFPCSFVQYSADGQGLKPAPLDAKDLKKGRYLGMYEKDGYYGQLGNLFINFKIFVEAIKNSSNKSIREVLMDMLNEMSSAVNSFWNFQIVEHLDANGDVILQIIDDNWAGKNTQTIYNFVHTGEKSVFLEANLDIDIPSEMTNQIILRRQEYANDPDSRLVEYTSNPDSKPIKTGGIFSKETDMFFRGIEYYKASKLGTGTGGSAKTTTNVNAQQQLDKLKLQKETWKKSLTNKGPKLGWFRQFAKIIGESQSDLQTETWYDPTTGEEVYTKLKYGSAGSIAAAAVEGITGAKPITEEYADTPSGRKFRKLSEDIAAAEESVKTTTTNTINANLSKIEVIPNPERFTINASSLDVSVSGDYTFRDNFRIYCCDDPQLFDVIKNNAFEDYVKTESNYTSQPLPIKYSFKILGKSGIRRGDVFNVYGIPKKYRDHGFFQVVEVDQVVSENMWTTTVVGQFRQQTQAQ